MTDISRNLYEIPAQEISIPCEPEELAPFIDEEIEFLKKHKSLFTNHIMVGGSSIPYPIDYSSVVKHLQIIRQSALNGDRKTIEEYIETARDLQLVIGKGILGQQVASLKSKGLDSEAQ